MKHAWPASGLNEISGAQSQLIGAPEPAPRSVPAPAQFDNIRGMIKAVFNASSVSITFDITDFVRTSGVAQGYMATPLMHEEKVLGAIRVLDRASRVFTSAERTLLDGFASLVVDQYELWRQASRDPLTGAMTRRAFTLDLQKAVAAHQRSGQDATLIMFDLDHFKSVNDTFGHAAGDAILQRTGEVVQEQLRAYDSFGRMGGEEFAILLSGPLSPAIEVAERVRQAIEQAVSQRYHHIGFTASFGVVGCSADSHSADALLMAADTQLYRAKQTGRNRVCALVPEPANAMI
ncbi:GGDEF domain-containing protein [Roseicitreum antarcticum]|uniref:diguanylate cyclase n=1 Tax=Roseicitreum antarcticum TaxID=564137 RepID=A0A1H2ZZE6_9RHOB|nr:sensor domain-containing diguanylate cyclase [Roseicitreum antarcticum]SDX22745.1 diguanylate cyclase (GGDEF) domain-containing protein [Roseicitreum antarcticum]